MWISFDTDNLLTLLKVVVGVFFFFFRKYSCTVSVTVVFVVFFLQPWRSLGSAAAYQ